MKIERAIVMAVPALDDRPWSSAAATPKPLVPVASQPILFHTLDALQLAGIQEALIVTCPDAVHAFRHAVGDGALWDMRISCRTSGSQLDVRAALGLASEFIDEQPVLVHRADALLRERLSEHELGFATDHLDALALMLAPARAPSHTAPPFAVGYLLSPRAVSIVREGPAGADPLPGLRLRGGRVRVLDVEGCLACHGDEATLLAANREALSRLRTAVTDAIIESSEIQGNVVIHPTATVRHTLVRGPAIVGAGSEIVDSYIGPYTSIGAGARIHGTEIEHSIVMDGARLMFVGSRLETSIIGRGASIARRFDMPSAARMWIGDGAEVALS